MKRITLNEQGLEDLKETLEYERDTFKRWGEEFVDGKHYGQAAERLHVADGLQIALDRFDTALNK